MLTSSLISSLSTTTSTGSIFPLLLDFDLYRCPIRQLRREFPHSVAYVQLSHSTYIDMYGNQTRQCECRSRPKLTSDFGFSLLTHTRTHSPYQALHRTNRASLMNEFMMFGTYRGSRFVREVRCGTSLAHIPLEMCKELVPHRLRELKTWAFVWGWAGWRCRCC